jgi:hypothetical protein
MKLVFSGSPGNRFSGGDLCQDLGFESRVNLGRCFNVIGQHLLLLWELNALSHSTQLMMGYRTTEPAGPAKLK